ncbi:DUF222 domain-containing protein [Nocardioides sp.]|uniref:HNH endonuclease signature motif containing protein n=1 Tax=Nocardioides sp. TaxID=35761 RepID=UPI003514A9BD
MSSSAVVNQASAVVACVRELVGLPKIEMSGDEALQAASLITSSRALLDATLLQIAEQLEYTDAAVAHGWASTKDLLTHLTGGHRGEGGGLLRAVGQLNHVPQVREALEQGHITLPQARAIAGSVVTLPRDPELREAVADGLLGLAVDDALDATGLTNALDDVVRAVDPDGHLVDLERGRARAEQGAHIQRYFSVRPDGRGGAWFRGFGSFEDAELVRSVLLARSAPMPSEPGACVRGAGPFGTATMPCDVPGCAHDGRDPRDSGMRMWDALVDVARAVADHPGTPTDHGTRPTVVVVIDEADLRRRVADAELRTHFEFGTGALPPEARTPDAHYLDGTPISVHSVRRLACDAGVLPVVLGSEGQLLDVGRRHRLVTPAIWSALVVRDRHCAFTGCTRPPSMTEAHHIEHWADGGATSLDNLVLLCRVHHRFVHASPWTIRMDHDTGKPVVIPPPQRTTLYPGQHPPRRASDPPSRAA